METTIGVRAALSEFGWQSDATSTRELISSLNAILADVFVLYVKTKNFHWHVSGPHFRDYHLLLDEQATQLFAITDPIAERVRKLGGRTVGSLSDISSLRRLRDSNELTLTTAEMLAELRRDNAQLAAEMRSAHALTEAHGDVATASLLENWIDETEGRLWFLSASTDG